MQGKARKNPWIPLVFFGRIWAFQWVTREKNKKMGSGATLVSGCAQNVSRAISILSRQASPGADLGD
jgi:hypothetical protein